MCKLYAELNEADPSVEITSPHSGKIQSLNAEAGKVVKVGQTLCEIDVDGEVEDVEVPEQSAPAPQAPPAPKQTEPVTRRDPAPAPPSPPPAPKPEPTQSNAAKPHRPARPHPLDETAVRFEGEAGILPAAPLSRGEIPDSVEARREGGGGSKRIVKASPATRTLAHKLNVDLESVTPTGDGGRVTKEDVEKYAAGGSSAPAPAPAAREATPARESAPAPRAEPVSRQSAPSPVPQPVYSSHRESGETHRMELGRNRKAMYKAMGSMGSVPHFGYVHSLDLTNLLPLMKAANPVKPPKPSYLASDVPSSLVQNTTAANGEEREKTSILAFLVKAMALALDEHPIMRSRVKERDGERWLEVADDAAIGIAVSDPKAGLVTPSLPPFDPRNSVGSINQALTQLRKTATRPSAPPNITISSVGPLGEAKSAMPVLPPGGGVAIAAVGRAAWENELVARNGRNGDGKVWDMTLDEVAGMGTKPVLKCNVGWSGDHRVLEGAELIAFTETWKRYVEEPWRWVNI